MMHKALRNVYGNTSSNDLSRWMMANTLIQTGFYQPGSFPFSYDLNRNGIEKMLRMLAPFEATKTVSKTTLHSDTKYEVRKS